MYAYSTAAYICCLVAMITFEQLAHVTVRHSVMFGLPDAMATWDCRPFRVSSSGDNQADNSKGAAPLTPVRDAASSSEQDAFMTFTLPPSGAVHRHSTCNQPLAGLQQSTAALAGPLGCWACLLL